MYLQLQLFYLISLSAGCARQRTRMRGGENDGDRRQSGGEQEGYSACQGTVGGFFAVLWIRII
jgi:hypothetical protein